MVTPTAHRSDDSDEQDDARALAELAPLVEGDPWPVKEAKSHLSKMVALCQDGRISLIGRRRPTAALISIRELARYMRQTREPRTWGELFHPTEALPSVGDVLRIAPERPAPRIRLVDGDRDGADTPAG